MVMLCWCRVDVMVMSWWCDVDVVLMSWLCHGDVMVMCSDMNLGRHRRTGTRHTIQKMSHRHVFNYYCYFCVYRDYHIFIACQRSFNPDPSYLEIDECPNHSTWEQLCLDFLGLLLGCSVIRNLWAICSFRDFLIVILLRKRIRRRRGGGEEEEKNENEEEMMTKTR